ncbi:MAG: ABC-2 transporter permease [Lachnospiraceae bacterium]|nr:ABC-2 transporter permease [Lachnospiraceae bacterium]
MKGLLIKDFRIVMNQKKFLVLYLFIAAVLGFSMDSTFIVSYVPMVATIIALSTISYDYNDNGLSFIMTLPNKPGDYAVAKYIFSVITVTAMWLVSIVIQFASFMIQKSEVSTAEVLISDAVMLPLFFLILAVMLPIELKYSPEKARVVMFVIFGVVMLAVLGGKSIIDSMAAKGLINPDKVTGAVQSFSGPAGLIAIYAACIIALSISMMISIRIMQNKEF